ncbi:MAG: hypothetical protein RIC55_11580 [Pirellulaceae bacterium]
MKRVLLTAAALLLFVSSASAQFGGDPLTWSVAQQRAWLRSQIAASVADPDALRDAVEKLGRMSDAQVLALVEARTRAVREQAYREALARQYQANGYGRGVVGYRPIITTLPQGASLSAGAVVSPDRRYVRINATPFFSSIGPVRTFNMYNGQTRVYNPNIYQPYSTPLYTGQPQNNNSQPRMRSWYDGVRTHYSYR